MRRTLTRRLPARSLVALFLGAVLVVTTAVEWVSYAEQAAASQSPNQNYTGQTSSVDQAGMLAGRRRFEAGARSAWHIHPAGQLIFIEEGRARVQRRGEPIRELKQHESDFTPASMPHWHGAAPDSHAIQASLSFGGIGPWLEPVTDGEYRGIAKPPSSRR
jgi:quercetin dioxygenase-like cupin family protein